MRVDVHERESAVTRADDRADARASVAVGRRPLGGRIASRLRRPAAARHSQRRPRRAKSRPRGPRLSRAADRHFGRRGACGDARAPVGGDVLHRPRSGSSPPHRVLAGLGWSAPGGSGACPSGGCACRPRGVRPAARPSGCRCFPAHPARNPCTEFRNRGPPGAAPVYRVQPPQDPAEHGLRRRRGHRLHAERDQPGRVHGSVDGRQPHRGLHSLSPSQSVGSRSTPGRTRGLAEGE